MIVRKLSLTAILVVGMGVAGWSRTATATTAHDDKTVIVTGEVLQLEPGKLIVVRSGGKEKRYVLSPDIVLPAEVEIGKTASLQLEAGPDGTSVVRRVTTTTLGPDGRVRETTEVTRTDPMGDTSATTLTTSTGRVDAYMPGKSITIVDPKGARATYVLGEDTVLPTEVIMGKKAAIYVAPKEQGVTTYEIERDGDVIVIKAKKKKPFWKFWE